MRTILAATCLTVALITAAPASAARPPIDPAKAERIARTEMRAYIDNYAEYVAEGAAYLAALTPEDRAELDPAALRPDPSISRWQIEDCDRETRYRVLCDWSIDYSDGTSDDGTTVVIVTRRGRYIVDGVY